MASFTAVPDYNPWLPIGEDTVYVMVTITAPADLLRTTGRAEVIIVDDSGSMGRYRKMEAARDAAAAAVEELEDGVEFAVIGGREWAEVVWPRGGRHVAVASRRERAAARKAISKVRAYGGTCISTWLDAARQLFLGSDAGLRHAVLITDGNDESETRQELDAAIRRCVGVFQCDCGGIGGAESDWKPEEIRRISDALHGHEGMVERIDDRAGQEALVRALRRLVRASQARVAPDLRLRITTKDADVDAVRQAEPKQMPLVPAARSTPIDAGPGGRVREYPLGGWAPRERRSYFLSLRFPRDKVGAPEQTNLVAQVDLVLADGTVAAEFPVMAAWTRDPKRATEVSAAVARHMTQSELAADIQAGVRALDDDDIDTATARLTRAWHSAKSLGDARQLENLAPLVEEDEKGNVHVRESTSTADRKRAETYSTTTGKVAWETPPHGETDGEG